MITDARALRPRYVPRELHHREGDIEHLTSVLKPIPSGLDGENALITGPSGAGKTTLARYVVETLERQTLDVRTGYVNAMSESTPAAILYRLLRDAGLGGDLRPEGVPRAEYVDRIRRTDQQLVLILDEVDVVTDDSLFGALYGRASVTLILITVDQDGFLSAVDQRIASRLRSAAHVHLEKYGHDELVDILRHRADAGLRLGAAPQGVLEYIAELAAGDARFAIALLRRAARRAAEDDREQLTGDLVDAVTDEARAAVETRHVENLSTHQRHLFEIVREHRRIDAGDLHDLYEARVDAPKSRRTRRRYLQNLERYGLIEKEGEKRSTTYRYYRH